MRPAVAFIIFTCIGWAQFKTTSPLVVAPVTVKDSHGRFVDGLTPEDLILYDNNVPQPIQMDWSQYPIDLVVAVGTGAASGAVIDKLGASGILFTELLAAEAGETALVTFSDEVKVHQDFTASSDKVTQALRMLRKEGDGARVLDGMRHGLRMLQQRPAGRRRVLLMIAEKRDRGSAANHAQVMELAHRLNAAVYWLSYSPFLQPFTAKPKTAEDLKPEAERIKYRACLLCPDPDDTPVPPDLGPGGMLYGLGELFRMKQPDLAALFTRTTGGRAIGFFRKDGLEEAIQAIGEEVHSQYIVTFQPKAREAASFHAIRIAAKNRPELDVRTREGYWAIP